MKQGIILRSEGVERGEWWVGGREGGTPPMGMLKHTRIAPQTSFFSLSAPIETLTKVGRQCSFNPGLCLQQLCCSSLVLRGKPGNEAKNLLVWIFVDEYDIVCLLY